MATKKPHPAPKNLKSNRYHHETRQVRIAANVVIELEARAAEQGFPHTIGSLAENYIRLGMSAADSGAK